MKLAKNEHLITFLSGMVAGSFIAFGGIAYILALAYLPADISKIVGACLFPLGLMLVCFTGTKLYTGRIGYVIDKNEVPIKKKIAELTIMVLGNFIGAALIGLIFFSISYKSDLLLTKFIGIVEGKTANRTYADGIFRPILCGVMVFLAVDFFKSFKNIGCKILFIFIPIFLFVFAGWDHCVANAFYYAAGLMAMAEKGVEIDATTIAWLFVNLFGCILGNSIGSIVTNLVKKALKITIKE